MKRVKFTESPIVSALKKQENWMDMYSILEAIISANRNDTFYDQNVIYQAILTHNEYDILSKAKN